MLSTDRAKVLTQLLEADAPGANEKTLAALLETAADIAQEIVESHKASDANVDWGWDVSKDLLALAATFTREGATAKNGYALFRLLQQHSDWIFEGVDGGMIPWAFREQAANEAAVH